MDDTVVVGFGGNVGTDTEIVERFRTARFVLARLGEVRAAALYRTQPRGPDQPAFLNTAVRVTTELSPEDLLAAVHEIENRQGRDRTVEARWGPRTLDLDVLVWGSRVIDIPELAVPHPHLHERRFALLPLVELLGDDFEIPNVGRAGDALARVADQQVELIASRW